MMTEVQLEENNVSLSPYCKYLLEKQERSEPFTCVLKWKYTVLQSGNPVHKKSYLN